MLELNKNNLKEINYNDIVAMAIAESGAMGEPNGFYVVTKDMKQYHLNFQYTDIKKNQLLDVFPILETLDFYASQVHNLEPNWKWFNMGMGNYLIVREKYYKSIEDYIKNNLGENYEYGELYKKWFDILKMVVSDK